MVWLNQKSKIMYNSVKPCLTYDKSIRKIKAHAFFPLFYYLLNAGISSSAVNHTFENTYFLIVYSRFSCCYLDYINLLFITFT